jgi:hypothetical protein
VEGWSSFAWYYFSPCSEVLELMGGLMEDFEYAWYLAMIISFGAIFAVLVLLNILFGILTGGL